MRVQDVLLIVCDMKGRKLEKKRVLLSQLKEFPNNPNVHPEEQVKALAQSMEQYGQYYPIVVDEDFMVLCGHGKKKALDYMGEKEADVTVMYGLSDKQKKKLLLEDNKIQDMSYVSFGDVERIIKEIGEVDITAILRNISTPLLMRSARITWGYILMSRRRRSRSSRRRKSKPIRKRSRRSNKGCSRLGRWFALIVVRR